MYVLAAFAVNQIRSAATKRNDRPAKRSRQEQKNRRRIVLIGLPLPLPPSGPSARARRSITFERAAAAKVFLRSRAITKAALPFSIIKRAVE